jgi:hypothetical protein
MKEPLLDNWMSILALLVAIVGGCPGILQIIEYFHSISLSGSVKFFGPTDPYPLEDGVFFAVTIVNEGKKNLVWRGLKGMLEANRRKLPLIPKLIPDTLLLNGKMPQPDLLNLQCFHPGIPVNAYLLLTAKHSSLSGIPPTEYRKLYLWFEAESGKSIELELPIGGHPVSRGETFPTHQTGFE